MSDLFLTILGGLMGGGVSAAGFGALMLRRNTTLEKNIEEGFVLRASQREYEKQALFELYGPLKMQFERSRRAMQRWDGRNRFLEGEVVRNGNIAARDLLLAKGHLIPQKLVEPAGALIEHYEVWLEKFDELRGEGKTSDAPFVFAGPKGYPFPKAAETAFLDEAERLQDRLSGGVSALA